MIKTKIQSKTGIILCCLLYFVLNSKGQNANSIWCFGDSAGINFADTSLPYTFYSNLDTRGSCVTIADNIGNLLFYANTGEGTPLYSTRIRNKNNDIMENGDSIIGGGWYNELCIVPFPNSDSLYYIFSCGVTSIQGLFYSVIDISQNNGLGKVIEKNTPIHNLRSWDAQIAIRHGNGRYWWLISKDNVNTNGDNHFHILLITPNGITDSIQGIGLNEFGGLGNLVFNKDGTKLLFSSYNGLVEVMDFDRCTGLLSNPKTVYRAPVQPRISGSAFSPDGNLVYISTSNGNSYLVQFDLNAANIPNSRDTIGRIALPFEAGGSLRLGPDNKLYWACAWTNMINFNYPYADTMYHYENMNLSVVRDPNIRGVGCNLDMYGFNLGGKRVYWGLPNNPDYSLGAVSGSICDSLTNSLESVSTKHFAIFPNPANESINVTGDFEESSHYKFQLIDLTGRILFTGTLTDNKISTSDFVSGFYVLKILQNNQVIQNIKMEILH